MLRLYRTKHANYLVRLSHYLIYVNKICVFSCYVQNVELLRTECENRFQCFKVCEMKVYRFIAPYCSDVDRTDDDIVVQVELIEVQCDSVIKSIVYIYLLAYRFTKIIQFCCQICAMFYST
jgi:hypothetical protein